MLAIFFLPLAILYYATGDQLSPALHAWVAGGVALGVYVMLAFYVQANEGWARVLGPFERLAEGDLTGKVDTAGLGGHFGLFLRLLCDINRSLGEIVAQTARCARNQEIFCAEGDLGRAGIRRNQCRIINQLPQFLRRQPGQRSQLREGELVIPVQP